MCSPYGDSGGGAGVRLWRKKAEPYKELQSKDAGLTANDVMTDKQVWKFTNTIEAERGDKLGKVTK